MPKEIIISDESVNIYGFRVITAGIDLSAYEKNPVVLWDHSRRHSDTKDVILPIARMTNLRKENKQLIGTPEFDSKDTFAAEIERKYEGGFINAASISFPTIEAMEYSYEPGDMLPGQVGPTITKCKLREISMTDIPGNENCVRLSHNGNLIQLNGKGTDDIKTLFPNKQIEPTMKKVIVELNAAGIAGSLPENANEELVAAGVKAITGALSAKDQEIVTLKKKVGELEAAAVTATKDALKKNATTLVESALSANKIVAAQKESYITLASASEEGYNEIKKILDGLQPYKSAASQLNGNGNTVELPASKEKKAELFEKHLSEGTMATLSAEHVTELYTAANGKAPSADTLKKLTGK